MNDEVSCILRGIIRFQWDEWNARKNKIKRNVSTKECEEIFFNKPFIVLPDVKHSFVEIRYAALGITDVDRLLTVIFTIRNHLVRVVSARDQSAKEKSFYTSRLKLIIK